LQINGRNKKIVNGKKMSFFLILNGKFYEKKYTKFYTPVLSISLEDLNLECQERNKLIFFCEEPRTNISLLMSRIEFYFTYQQDYDVIGQLSSKVLINYNIDKNPNNQVYENCIIFTKGYKITEILVYLPTHELKFLRELVYHFYEKSSGLCDICFEKKTNMVSVDKYHKFCLDCILKTNKKCPICRQNIH
jgi:hypothetical protein